MMLDLKQVPHTPGIYKFFADNKIIYIGKAINLKKRVSSYFNKNHTFGKIRTLVARIYEIKFIVVDTELDALLLENNLIKKYQPRYNIALKDDKTYPWICIKNERFPRVFLTRNVVKDGSQYFGPYASVKMMNTLLDLVREIYTPRTCNYKLSESNIEKEKFKVCLEYHIGNCLGPCEGKQTHEDYMVNIGHVKSIIKGQIGEVIAHLKDTMEQFAANLLFEEAQRMKDKIEILQNYQAKSTIVNPSINNVDVFSIITDDDHAYINFLKVMSGCIVQGFTLEMKKGVEQDEKTLLEMGIVELKERFHSESKEIIVPFELNMEGADYKQHVPQRGDKRSLLEMSERNAKFYRQDKYKQMRFTDPEKHTERILKQVKSDLRLTELPSHIECFDNSNFQGTHPVAACVVFKNAKPSKKDYRHFNIKTVEGPDDFASMEEVVYRRYKRLVEEKESLPQLIIIDGGKGQLGSALKSLDKLGLRGKIAIVGIAKKLEEIFFPGDSVPLYINKKSESLKLIQHLRNEAHRFGITHHRNKRSKAAIGSELHEIPGIGDETVKDLFKFFASISKIKSADLKSLTEAVKPAKAKIIWEYFQNKKEPTSE